MSLAPAGDHISAAAGDPDQDSSALESEYDRARTLSLRLIGALCLLVALIYGLKLAPAERLTLIYLWQNDLPLAALFVAALAFRPKKIVARAWISSGRARATMLASLLLLIGVGWAGYYLVFHGYDLGRDEQMASFDAAIFSARRLFWPIPAEWREFAEALNMTHMLAIGDREYWVSAYLPMHAASRSIAGLLVDPALISPLWAAVGGGFVYLTAIRLFPGSRSAALVALLLYVTSSQVLVTAMTAFSMSMHVALNMLWLWLFLVDRPRAHGAAILVGFVATGIHQPLFHPLFVLPCFLLLIERRDWQLLGFYLAGYTLIAMFWLAWPLWISSHGSVSAVALQGGAGVGFVERLTVVLNDLSSFPPLWSIWTMAANLLRFIVWQHPLLLPLLVLGATASWRLEPLMRALTLGLVLPILVMTILLPWQGPGWGYRYLHPVLGNAVLLAAYGWHRLETGGVSLRQPMVLCTALAVLVLLPLHAWMAWRMSAPHAQIRDELSKISADIVIIDTQGSPTGRNLVLNRYDLSGPIFLNAFRVRPDQMKILCERGRVAFYEAPRLAPLAEFFGAKPALGPTDTVLRLQQAAKIAGCNAIRIP